MTFHVDLFSIAGWGEWIYNNGAKNFYGHEIWVYSWPTQPPLANLVYAFGFILFENLNTLFVSIATFIALNHLAPTYFLWWFDFVRWFGGATLEATGYNYGYLISIKLLAILADITIALIIFALAKKRGFKWAGVLSTVYLISPFSWYLSSLWGQYDQLSYLFLLLSFILLTKRVLLLAPFVFALSVLLKPTSLIFVPLFLWIYFRQKPSLMTLLIGNIGTVVFSLYLTSLFTDKNLLEFIRGDLIRLVFYKAEFRVSTNSFNFWRILIGNVSLNQNYPFLLIPAKIWGYLAFVLLNLMAFRISSSVNFQNTFKAMFVIGAGSWLFMTNMMERYFFAGVISGLLVSIYNPQVFKYWLILSLTYWLNLYHSWWSPESLSALRNLLTFNEGIVTRIISLGNTMIFCKVTYDIYLSKDIRLFKQLRNLVFKVRLKG